MKLYWIFSHRFSLEEKLRKLETKNINLKKCAGSNGKLYQYQKWRERKTEKKSTDKLLDNFKHMLLWISEIKCQCCWLQCKMLTLLISNFSCWEIFCDFARLSIASFVWIKFKSSFDLTEVIFFSFAWNELKYKLWWLKNLFGEISIIIKTVTNSLDEAEY